MKTKLLSYVNESVYDLKCKIPNQIKAIYELFDKKESIGIIEFNIKQLKSMIRCLKINDLTSKQTDNYTQYRILDDLVYDIDILYNELKEMYTDPD